MPAAHLPLVDQCGAASAPPQHVVAERVQRAYPAPRAFGHVGEPVAHRVLGPHVVRDGGDRARAPAAVDEQAEPLGEHPRLARPRGRDHACRARVVHDRRELVGRELGLGRDGSVGGEHALLEVVAMHEHVTVGHRGSSGARSAVAPRGRAVGEHARRRPAARHRAEALRPRRSGPTPCARRGRRSCWPGSGSRGAPARTRSGARARTAPRGLDLRRPQLVGRALQLDHHRDPLRPVAVQRRRAPRPDRASAASSITTRSAAAHGSGTGAPGPTITPRPRRVTTPARARSTTGRIMPER